MLRVDWVSLGISVHASSSTECTLRQKRGQVHLISAPGPSAGTDREFQAQFRHAAFYPRLRTKRLTAVDAFSQGLQFGIRQYEQTRIGCMATVCSMVFSNAR